MLWELNKFGRLEHKVLNQHLTQNQYSKILHNKYMLTMSMYTMWP